MTNELITSGFGREKGETVLNFYLVPFLKICQIYPHLHVLVHFFLNVCNLPRLEFQTSPVNFYFRTLVL